MTYRGDIDAARAKIGELEQVLEARDRELAALDRKLAKRDAALQAALPEERHRVRIRQLEAALAETRREAAAAVQEADRARRAADRVRRR